MEKGESRGTQGTKRPRARSETRCRAMRRALLRAGLAGVSYEIPFDTTQSDRGRSKCLHDFTRERHRTPERVPEGRWWPCFEGAHFIRRCAPISTSAHLGKPRRFLRRCAPFSKVRTKSAHLPFRASGGIS